MRRLALSVLALYATATLLLVVPPDAWPLAGIVGVWAAFLIGGAFAIYCLVLTFARYWRWLHAPQPTKREGTWL